MTIDRLRTFDSAVERLDRIRPHLTATIDAIRDAFAGHPRAASYTGSDKVSDPWCWGHEQTVSVCHEAGQQCSGEAIDVKDPTGEAGIAGDRARDDLLAMDKDLILIELIAGRILSRVERYHPRVASDKERRDTEADNVQSCTSCARGRQENGQPIFSAMSINTTAKGNLSHPTALCGWCYDQALRFGSLPSVEHVQAHHAGRKIRRTA